MSVAGLSLVGLGVTLGAFTALWLVSLRLRDASIADPFWGPGFLLLATVYHVGAADPGPRGLLTLGLVATWATRLGIHLLSRNRSHGEDPRYAAMRARHGERFGRVSLFTVFWLQAAILWIVAMPVLGATASRAPLSGWDALGVGMFVAGFLTEAVADGQLARFRADPDNRGRVLDRGLWRYSRHPNYFGDAVVWWGLYAIAAAGGAAWTAVGPALMTFLLVKVSGVALLERDMAGRRPAYADYVRRTSAFVPWFPRSPGA